MSKDQSKLICGLVSNVSYINITKLVIMISPNIIIGAFSINFNNNNKTHFEIFGVRSNVCGRVPVLILRSGLNFVGFFKLFRLN